MPLQSVACSAGALRKVKRSIQPPSLCTRLFPWLFFGHWTMMAIAYEDPVWSMTIAKYFDETCRRKAMVFEDDGVATVVHR